MGAAFFLVVVLAAVGVGLALLGLAIYGLLFGLVTLLRLVGRMSMQFEAIDSQMAVVDIGGSNQGGVGRRLNEIWPQRGGWVREKIFLGQSFSDYLKAQITPFNLVAGVIVLLGLGLTVIRFTGGLAATTNLTDTNPWGIWIGFDVLVGVALAAGGYTMATAVYIFRLKDYHPMVRPAILTGFLGYAFVVVGLMFDLGRPWRLPFPFIVSPGVTSVMFSVGLHVMLYLGCLFVEFTPPLFEWLDWKRLREWAVRLTFFVTVTGVMLSTLHQAALGGLFLIVPEKLHPLWYSPLLPVLFFVSSIFAGLSMLIVESALSHKYFSNAAHHSNLNQLTIGLGKAAAVVMLVYFALKMMALAHADSWDLLLTPLGLWYLLEMLVFVLAPILLFLQGSKIGSMKLIRLTAALTVLGVIVNRLNVAVIALNWNAAERYVPRWSEVAITIFIVTLGVLTFRWIVNRMPVLYEHPSYEEAED